MSAPDPGPNIVILGAGIIGCTTAYFLSTHPKFSRSKHTITILEASSVAAAASGRAGGLLAQWAYPACIVPLSFRLHRELADKFDGVNRWGYREVECGNVEFAKGKKGRRSMPPDLDWLDGQGRVAYEAMAGAGETAQVHPEQFTKAMAEEAQNNGVRIVYGKATRLEFADGKKKERVTGVTYTPTSGTSEPPSSTEPVTIPASTVIVALGPWSQKLYPSIPGSTVRAHSVVLRPSRPFAAHALFTSISLPNRTTTPEIYPRPDGTVYMCGEGDSVVSLPATAHEVVVDEARVDEILESAGAVSDVLRDAKVERRQACYLPNIRGGRGPLVGRTGTQGVVLATGHTCWGIQNSAGTGRVVSEIVFDGDAGSASVGELDPRRWGL